MTKTLGILMFDDVEVLDALGPFEVFSVANRLWPEPPFHVRLISTGAGTVTARGGLRVQTDHGLADAPDLDVLLVPGGVTRAVEADAAAIAWLAGQVDVAVIASVCTGAFLLAEAGLLKGRRATTHWEDMDEFAARFPDVPLVRDVRWVGDGRVYCSAGISAGLDLSLHLVETLAGADLATATARQMDYRWQRDAA